MHNLKRARTYSGSPTNKKDRDGGKEVEEEEENEGHDPKIVKKRRISDSDVKESEEIKKCKEWIINQTRVFLELLFNKMDCLDNPKDLPRDEDLVASIRKGSVAKKKLVDFQNAFLKSPHLIIYVRYGKAMKKRMKAKARSEKAKQKAKSRQDLDQFIARLLKPENGESSSCFRINICKHARCSSPPYSDSYKNSSSCNIEEICVRDKDTGILDVTFSVTEYKEYPVAKNGHSERDSASCIDGITKDDRVKSSKTSVKTKRFLWDAISGDFFSGATQAARYDYGVLTYEFSWSRNDAENVNVRNENSNGQKWQFESLSSDQKRQPKMFPVIFLNKKDEIYYS